MTKTNTNSGLPTITVTEAGSSTAAVVTTAANDNTSSIADSSNFTGAGLLSPRKGRMSKVRDALERVRNSPLKTAPLNLYSEQHAQPWTPPVRGRARDESPLPANQAPLSADRMAQMQEKVDTSIDNLIDHKTSPGLAVPPLCNARTSDPATTASINALFGTPAADATGPSLGEQLLTDVKKAFGDDGADGAQAARDGALMLARSLSTVTKNVGNAARAWSAITRDAKPGEQTLPDEQRMNKALREIACSPLAFDALWKIKQTNGHAITAAMEPEPFKFALQACDKLFRGGALPRSGGSPGGINDFVQHAAVRVGLQPPGAGMAANAPPPSLGSDEAPDILACLALLHAVGKGKAGEDTPTSRQQAAAYLAWRNGNHESGPGSHFNEMVHRMHKFTDWVDRAVDRPGVVKNPLKAAANALQSVAGANLSPLSAMKFGLAGSDLGLAPVGKQKFEEALGSALKQVGDACASQALDAADGQTLVASALRYAIVDRWKTSIGLRKNVTLDANDRAQVLAAAAEFGVNINDPKVKNHPLLKQKLNLKTLETWGKEALVGNPTEIQALSDQIKTARSAARATVDKLGNQPTAKELEDLMVDALTNTIGVTFRHQGTLGVDAVVGFSFDTKNASFSAVAGPQVKLGTSKQSSVRAGTTSAGTEIFIGTERRYGGQFSAVARLGGEINFDAAYATLGGNASAQMYGREQSYESGVAIRMPKGSKNQKEVGSEVVKFLFAKANERMAGTAITGPQLWESFAQKFIDKEEMSINYQTNNSTTVRRGGSVAAAARVGGGDTAVGPTASIAGEYSKGHIERKDLKGRVPIHMVNDGTRKTAQAQAGLSGTLPGIGVSMGIIDEIKFANPGLGQARMDFTIGGEQGQVRLAIDNGRVNPKLSLAYHEYRNEADYFKRVESRRAIWVAAMAASGDGDGAVDNYLRQVKALNVDGQSGGSRAYLDRNRLDPDAAKKLDVLMGDAALLKRQISSVANDAALARIDHEIKQVLKDPANWTPDRLAVFEIEAHTVDKGVDAIVSARAKMQASSTLRYLAELRLPGEYKTGGGPVAGPSKDDVKSILTKSESLESLFQNGITQTKPKSKKKKKKDQNTEPSIELTTFKTDKKKGKEVPNQ